MNTLLNEIDRKRENKGKVEYMREVLDERLKTKVMLSMRYYLLCTRSQRLFAVKLNKKLLVKALDAMRYYTVSQRVTH